MDELRIRQGLDTALAMLKEVDDQRDILVNMIDGYQALLRIRGNNTSQPPPTQQMTMPITMVPAIANAKKPGKRKGGGVRKANSWRALIKEKLQAESGQSILSKDVWAYLQSRGKTTKAKDPIAAVDLTARDIPGVKKTGPRLWKWVGIQEPTPSTTNHAQEPAVGKKVEAPAVPRVS